MDEPRKHPRYLALLALTALGTVPFPFVAEGGLLGSHAEKTFGGVPLWLWSSVGFTLLLSGVIAWGVVRYWDPEEGTDGDD